MAENPILSATTTSNADIQDEISLKQNKFRAPAVNAQRLPIASLDVLNRFGEVTCPNASRNQIALKVLVGIPAN